MTTFIPSRNAQKLSCIRLAVARFQTKEGLDNDFIALAPK
jgi:hypothetical protein